MARRSERARAGSKGRKETGRGGEGRNNTKDRLWTWSDKGMTAVALGLARDAPVSALVNADGHCALARCLGVVLSIYRRRAATPYPFSGRRLALTDGGMEWGGRGGRGGRVGGWGVGRFL